MSKRTRSLVLVGTVHRDPKGYAKLFRLLEEERPSIITVEISPYSRAFRTQHSAALRARFRENLQMIGREKGRPLREIISRSSVLEIFLALREPYEWRAAKDYAERHGIALGDIDLSCYAKDKLSHLAELISLENVRALLHLPSFDLPRQVESQYARAKFLFAHPPSIWPTGEEVINREAYMAEKIRGFARPKNGEKVLHIGGWEHLIEFPQGKSLFGLLKDLQPHRIILTSMANEWYRSERTHAYKKEPRKFFTGSVGKLWKC